VVGYRTERRLRRARLPARPTVRGGGIPRKAEGASPS